jgi:hypothetical protein
MADKTARQVLQLPAVASRDGLVHFTPENVPQKSFRGPGLRFVCLGVPLCGKMEKKAAKTHTKKTTRPYYVYGLCDLTGKFCASARRNSVVTNAPVRSLKL